MIKTMSRMAMTAAAATLAFAPIAAQANTRASDNAPVYTSNSASQPGLGRAAEGEEVAGKGAGIVILLLAAAAVIAGIVVLADNEDDDQSPGT